MKKKLYIAVIAALAFFGCSEKEDVAPVSKGHLITFNVTTDSEWNTRSLPTPSPTVEQLEGESPVPLYLHTSVSPGFESDAETATRGTMLQAGAEINSIGLSAYKYGGSRKLQDATPDFFNNINLVRTNNAWSTSTKYYWPADGTKLAFYAYYPYDAERIQVQDVTGPMQILYTQRTDPADQVDFMVGSLTNQSFNNSTAVNIPLQHALTAVKFVMADEDKVVTGHIQSVTFTNLLRSAMYTVGTGWNTTSGTMIEPEIKLTLDGDGILTMHNNEVVTGDNTFLMIPQAFNSNQQKIVIELMAGTKHYTLSYSLQGTPAWEPNTTVVYKVSTQSLNVLDIGNVNFATQWGSIANPLKSAFAENDAIGVFAVDGSGTVINSNIKYSYKRDANNQLKWMKDDDQITFFPSDYTFYAYYPYKATLSGAPAIIDKVLVNEEMPTAAQFFSAVRANWSLPADQHELATIQANDLQFGRSTISNATLFNFPTMEHAFGLTGTTLNSKTITKKRTFTVSTVGNATTAATYTHSDDTQQLTIRATNVFDTNKPYGKTHNSVTTYYYIVKGSATLNATTTEDRWLESITAAAADNAYAAYSATSRRSRWDYLSAEWNFPYTSSKVPQTFKAEDYEGFNYVLEVWGAKGGSSADIGNGGNGAYVRGTIALAKNEKLYVYCGEQPTTGTGGWNGGGSNFSTQPYGGGGATDIALQYGTWNSDTHLYSRIIVAGGGGGAGSQSSDSNKPYGGGGGGWIGANGHGNHYGEGGKLDRGGKVYRHDDFPTTDVNPASDTEFYGAMDDGTGTHTGKPYEAAAFGVGGSCQWGSEILGGGGGGWYGGGCGGGQNNNGTGGGGSSWAWTDAITVASKKLSAYFPSGHTAPDGKYKLTSVAVTAGYSGYTIATTTGNNGHGKARITLTRPE